MSELSAGRVGCRAMETFRKDEQYDSVQTEKRRLKNYRHPTGQMTVSQLQLQLPVEQQNRHPHCDYEGHLVW